MGQERQADPSFCFDLTPYQTRLKVLILEAGGAERVPGPHHSSGPALTVHLGRELGWQDRPLKGQLYPQALLHGDSNH